MTTTVRTTNPRNTITGASVADAPDGGTLATLHFADGGQLSVSLAPGSGSLGSRIIDAIEDRLSLAHGTIVIDEAVEFIWKVDQASAGIPFWSALRAEGSATIWDIAHACGLGTEVVIRAVYDARTFSGSTLDTVVTPRTRILADDVPALRVRMGLPPYPIDPSARECFERGRIPRYYTERTKSGNRRLRVED